MLNLFDFLYGPFLCKAIYLFFEGEENRRKKEKKVFLTVKKKTRFN